MSLRDLALSKDRRKRRGRRLSSKESRSMRRKGYDAERSLVRKLRSLGFRAVRIPSSAPSSEPLPDVFATMNDGILAIEVKASNEDRIYFRSSQVRKLFEFLDMFIPYKRKAALLAGKFPYKWVFKMVEEVGDYIIRRDDESSIHLEYIFKD
ncbi:endonuclease [Candidatus Bathyarchaeota archaeon]|nr:MAG: endonuclease [Candidatus Bathyarchaeota archaeon]